MPRTQAPGSTGSARRKASILLGRPGLLAALLAAALAAGSASAAQLHPPGSGQASLVAGDRKPPAVSITKATATRGVVALRVRIADFRMYPALVGKRPNKPDGGHWHILVDGKYNNASASASLGKTLKLEPGSRRIVVELANNDHSSLTPPVRSKRVTVRIG